MTRINILIVDDHTLLREMWTLYLNDQPGLHIIGECGTAEEAIEMVNQFHPDIILMDINLPGINGITATEIIKNQLPSIKILAVTMHTNISYLKKMIQNGASGYVTKTSSLEEMQTAIIEVYNGNVYICKEMKEVIIAQSFGTDEREVKLSQLSDREIEIIQLIKKGYYSKEISNKLGITLKTVNSHRYNILKKLALKNTAALVHFINSNLVKIVDQKKDQ